MPPYENTVPNQVLLDLMKANLEALGLEVSNERKRTSRGSTDFGNVSRRGPGRRGAHRDHRLGRARALEEFQKAAGPTSAGRRC